MVRSPVLPIETYLDLDRKDPFDLAKDPLIQRAVGVGSPTLLAAIKRSARDVTPQAIAHRTRSKLLRYLIRMSMRPTPYGLFAGCANVMFGDRTSLSMVSSLDRFRTRPDMGWLIDFVGEVECDVAVRRKLRLITNPLIRLCGDRAILAKEGPEGSKKIDNASVRATRVVATVFDLAKQGIGHEALSARILQSSPSADPDRVDILLADLWKQGFLSTDLRPPLTADLDPAGYVLSRLETIPEAAHFHERLKQIIEACGRWSALGHDQSIDGLKSLMDQMGTKPGSTKDTLVHVDAAIALEGRVGPIVAREAANAVELMLRLTPFPRGSSSMAGYRNAFIRKYGQDREVPLLELVDPDLGLGTVEAHGNANVGLDSSRVEGRSRALLEIACSALRRRTLSIALDEQAIRDLESWTPDPDYMPISLDLNVLIAAPSAEAIDRGDFLMVVGPNLGACSAGRNFGRFASLHGVEQGVGLLLRAAETEQSIHYAGHLWVEVVYLPSNKRSANVAIRPVVRSHELVVGASPSAANSRSISLHDLVVGVSDGRFYVRSIETNQLVRFVSGHMLNDYGAPPTLQFLLRATDDGIAAYCPFHWGPAEGFPFLPRVQCGRIVLRAAEWKIYKASVDRCDEGSLKRWCDDWGVPRYVHLTFADKRLALDLAQADHLHELLAEVAKLSGGNYVVIQELLPDFTGVWLKDKEGQRYYSELVVPLVLEQPQKRPQVRPTYVARSEFERHNASRLRPPGGDWLFVKLYGPRGRQDELISSLISPFANDVVRSGLADGWFFIRYADPDEHIRLRFHMAADRVAELFTRVCEWATAMMAQGSCHRFGVDTYDREIERFGGIRGVCAAERLFSADSAASVRVVEALRSKHWDNHDNRLVLFALIVDDLLKDLGFEASERLEWYTSRPGVESIEGGREFRRLKVALREAIAGPSAWLLDQPQGDQIRVALDRRAQAIRDIAMQLRDLETHSQLSVPLRSICESYTHLSLNRVGGAADERMTYELMKRTLASLERSPLRDAPVAWPLP